MSESIPKLGPLLRLGNAVSPSAEEVDKKLAEVVIAEERSRALAGSKLDAISAVWDVAAEASQEDWNGEGAIAVDSVTAGNAVRFIQTLPAFLTMPEISPEPDGGISLDWIESRARVLSISIGRSRSLPIAWLDGNTRGYCVVSFDEDMPNRVLNEIATIRINGSSSVRFK
jgi:hypothetical protein